MDQTNALQQTEPKTMEMSSRLLNYILWRSSTKNRLGVVNSLGNSSFGNGATSIIKEEIQSP